MATAEQAAPRTRTDSIFFPAMAVAMALTVFIGFARSYYLKPVFQAPPELSGLMMIHGLVFTAWIAILIAQTGLVATNRRATHMKLGLAGFGVAGLMLILGTLLAVDALRRNFTPAGGPPPAVFFAVPIGDMIGFIIMLWLGWSNRPRADYHKRYMLLGTALLLDAAIARFPLDFVQASALPISFVGVDLFIVAVAIYDFTTRRRIHPATLVSAVVVICSQVLKVLIGGTALWQSFAHSLV